MAGMSQNCFNSTPYRVTEKVLFLGAKVRNEYGLLIILSIDVCYGKSKGHLKKLMVSFRLKNKVYSLCFDLQIQENLKVQTLK